jgi:hypothetical protein
MGRKKIKDPKGPSFSIRLIASDHEKLMSACYRAMTKPSLFAQDAVNKAVDELILQQKKYGYQCMLPPE